MEILSKITKVGQWIFVLGFSYSLFKMFNLTDVLFFNIVLFFCECIILFIIYLILNRICRVNFFLINSPKKVVSEYGTYYLSMRKFHDSIADGFKNLFPDGNNYYIGMYIPCIFFWIRIKRNSPQKMNHYDSDNSDESALDSIRIKSFKLIKEYFKEKEDIRELKRNAKEQKRSKKRDKNRIQRNFNKWDGVASDDRQFLRDKKIDNLLNEEKQN